MIILLFDGQCNLCNSWVKFVVKRDSSKKIKFASLQSKEGEKLLESHQIAKKYDESLVLLEGNKYYIKSTAAIKTLSLLDGWERHLKLLIFIPRPIRDFFYSLVAKYRYKLFGRLEVCMIPSSDLHERFLTEIKK